MRKIRWLHISDLHFGLNNYFVEEMREKIKLYVKNNLLEDEFQYLFVTGDLKYSKTCKKYTSQIREFIFSLADIIKVPQNKIFIVAGNHDLERTGARIDVCKGILEDYKKECFNIDSTRYTVLKQSQTMFNKYANDMVDYNIMQNIKNSPHFVITDENINILLLNTTLTCCRDGEEGRLLIGREFLQKALKNIDREKPTIVLGHHPFEWFDKEEAVQLESMLKDNNIYMYLCGHQHIANAKNIQEINSTKNLYEIACGTMLDEHAPYDNSEMGFSVGFLDLEENNGMVMAYKYQKRRNGWHKDTTFSLPQDNESGDFIINGEKSFIKKNDK